MSGYPFFESVLIAEIHQVAAVYGVVLASAPVQFVGAIREANPVSDVVVVGDDTSSIVVDISVADKFAAPLRTLVRVCGHVVIATGVASVAARVYAAVPDLDFPSHKTVLLKRRAFLLRQGLLDGTTLAAAIAKGCGATGSSHSTGGAGAKVGVGAVAAAASIDEPGGHGHSHMLSVGHRRGSRGKDRIKRLYGAAAAATESGGDEDDADDDDGGAAAGFDDADGVAAGAAAAAIHTDAAGAAAAAVAASGMPSSPEPPATLSSGSAASMSGSNVPTQDVESA